MTAYAPTRPCPARTAFGSRPPVEDRSPIPLRAAATFVARAAYACALAALSSMGLVDAVAAEATGRELAYSTAKGNCLACHRIPSDPGAVTMADIGPPLLGMRARYPERATLKAQIWDATAVNPETVMPPFGRNGVLTDAEIERIVDYLYER